MSETKKREKWFKMLDAELDKYFDEKEKHEIISYYQEMMDDKLEHGDDIDEVLDAYEPQAIARQMIPEVMTRRKHTVKKASSNAWLIVLLLFSTPILIPLGVVYLSLMIVALSLIISGVAVMISGFGAVVIQIVRSLSMGLAFSDMMLSIGIALVALVICLLVGYALVSVSWWLLQHLAIWFSKLIIRKRD